MFEFAFKGASRSNKDGTKYQFLLFLIIGGKEVPFWEAKKQGLVQAAQRESIFEATTDLYETGCQHVKLFIQEQEFGKARLMYPFYIKLGCSGLDNRQIVRLSPLKTLPKAYGWKFEAMGRFLSVPEVLTLLDPNTIGARLVGKIPLPPRPVLQQVASIERLKTAVSCSQRVRKLRIRGEE